MSSTSIGSDVRERHSLRRSRAFVIGAVASSSLLGSILLVALSREGVHASNDSFTYLGAANNLAQGEGWTYPFGDVGSPVTLFPPLYPLLLTVPRVLGVPTFGWVFWQNAVLLCAFGVAVGLTVADATRDRAMPSVLAALLVQLGTPTLMVYAHIWSETLFFPLIVLILASLARHLATRRTGPLIVAAALPAGDLPAGKPLRMSAGGDEGFSATVACDGYPEDSVLIVAWSDHPVEGPGSETTEVHITRVVLRDGAFHVVDTLNTEQPTTYGPRSSASLPDVFSRRGRECGLRFNPF